MSAGMYIMLAYTQVLYYFKVDRKLLMYCMLP